MSGETTHPSGKQKIDSKEGLAGLQRDRRFTEMARGLLRWWQQLTQQDTSAAGITNDAQQGDFAKPNDVDSGANEATIDDQPEIATDPPREIVVVPELPEGIRSSHWEGGPNVAEIGTPQDARALYENFLTTDPRSRFASRIQQMRRDNKDPQEIRKLIEDEVKSLINSVEWSAVRSIESFMAGLEATTLEYLRALALAEGEEAALEETGFAPYRGRWDRNLTPEEVGRWIAKAAAIQLAQDKGNALALEYSGDSTITIPFVIPMEERFSHGPRVPQSRFIQWLKSVFPSASFGGTFEEVIADDAAPQSDALPSHLLISQNPDSVNNTVINLEPGLDIVCYQLPESNGQACLRFAVRIDMTTALPNDNRCDRALKDPIIRVGEEWLGFERAFEAGELTGPINAAFEQYRPEKGAGVISYSLARPLNKSDFSYTRQQDFTVSVELNVQVGDMTFKTTKPARVRFFHQRGLSTLQVQQVDFDWSLDHMEEFEYYLVKAAETEKDIQNLQDQLDQRREWQADYYRSAMSHLVDSTSDYELTSDQLLQLVATKYPLSSEARAEIAKRLTPTKGS